MDLNKRQELFSFFILRKNITVFPIKFYIKLPNIFAEAFQKLNINRELDRQSNGQENIFTESYFVQNKLKGNIIAADKTFEM